MTEVYPHPTDVEPKEMRFGDFKNGSLEWDNLQVAPGSSPSLPTTTGFSQSPPSSISTGASPAVATSGALAFTGTDVALLVLGAALLIVVGYAILRLNRQRRRAS